MKTQFTKAPWLMNTTKKFLDNKGLAITDDKSRLICEVSHDLRQLTLGEYEANAKLIAAAPELLTCIDLVLGSFALEKAEKFTLLARLKVAIKTATE